MAGSKIPLLERPPQLHVPPRLRQLFQRIPPQWRQVMRTKRFRVIAPATVAGLLIVTLAVQALVGVFPGFASSVSGASFSTGTDGKSINFNSTIYAKSSASLPLTVQFSSDTTCVTLTNNATTTPYIASSPGVTVTSSTQWVFSFITAPAATPGNTNDGPQSWTANAFPSANVDRNGVLKACTGSNTQTRTASYVLDNSGPTFNPVYSPHPGWNNGPVTVQWNAADAGSGVASQPPNSTSSTDGITLVQTTAADRLGTSSTSPQLPLQVDTQAPTFVNANFFPAANSYGWNNTSVSIGFACFDPTPTATPGPTYIPASSGIATCTTSMPTISTEGQNQSFPAAATDNAGNKANSSIGSVNIDETKPSIAASADRAANGNGWYNADVTVSFSCQDNGAVQSGIASCPGKQTVHEGGNQSAGGTTFDKAGNSASTSLGGINVDETAPVTAVTAPSGWNNTDVPVTLAPSDNLSGVANTYYTLDSGAQQSGTNLTVSSEGDHVLTYWSVDKAGNVETHDSTHNTIHIKIDKTNPTITDAKSPLPNAAGWNNSAVTVTFTCNDPALSDGTPGSGIASCTTPQSVTTEGKGQIVTGTAKDNAGNSATDYASVSIDETKPSIAASADRAANANGWYNADVTVSFSCQDNGAVQSGVASCPDAQTLHEGANQSASGTTADAAGNSASTSLGGINVDETAPTLDGSATTSPDGAGWYNGDVTVHWTCSDALSNIDGSCPADSTITGEGSNLSAGASVSDKAGNTTGKTVGGINIDRTAPTTSASVPDPLPTGWYAGPVQVTLGTLPDLSGVAATYYSIDGGSAQSYSAPFSDSLPGIHTITFWSVDNAGNTEANTKGSNTITLKIDNIAPSIQGNASPPANGFGWNNGPVTVGFKCSDNESGIAACSDPIVLSNEGAGQSAVGNAMDNAGNTASAKVDNINIDLTAPDLSGAPSAPANAAGWYNGDVTIHWSATDGLSGVDPATAPGDSLVTGEGSNLGAGPVSVADKAGNTRSASVSGIKIDRTAPGISGKPTSSANGAGWYNSAVTVHFTCSDPNLADGTAGSGIATCSNDKVLSSNGANQSATSDAPADKAGNLGTPTTVGGINIDGLPPQSSAQISCTGNNGYCHGNTAGVILTAQDQDGLSGVKEIHYKVDGGNEQIASGANTDVKVPLAAKSGTANVLFWAVDNAGNAEAQNGVTLKYDNLAPIVTHTLNPNPNAAGWNNSNVTVHFDAVDDAGGSGVDSSTVTQDQTISNETAGTTVNGSASDLAGNTGTDSVVVKLDKTAPSISGAATSSPNTNGWYKGPVTVHFTCSDALSTIAVCPADVILTSDGGGQSVSGTAIDKAGNSASVTVSGINIDQSAPQVTITGFTDGAYFALGAAPTVGCTATDSGGSGLAATCTFNVTGGTTNGVGTYSVTASATDLAGNTGTASAKYYVRYGWSGFLQPVNDTHYNTTLQVSVFKAGSTVPVKFQLLNASGTPVQANSLPGWGKPQQGSMMTATIDETVFSDTATTGGSFRWDSTSQQYIYNWGTQKTNAGYYWRIFAQLDDGTTQYVDLGLR